MDLQHRLIRFTTIAGTLILTLASFGPVMSAQTNTDQVAAVVNSNTQFALKLYQNTANTTSGNFIYSPYSISEALALVDAGAKGSTDSQIRTAMNASLSQTDLPSAMLALRTDLLVRGNHGDDTATALPTLAPNVAPPHSLRIANALWGEQTFPFDKTYTALVNTNYNGALHPVDFINAPEPSRQAINNWVAQQTDNHIKDIMPQGIIDNLTRLVLVNAIYFNNAWRFHPDPQLTQEGQFTSLDSTQPPVTVPMMLMTQDNGSPLDYLKGSNYQAVEVPYADNFGTMLIIVPDAGQYMTVEKSFDANQLNTIVSGLKSSMVRLTMPRFTFSSALDLQTPMRSFGMINAFNPDTADFSGIGTTRLFINAILHKAFINVDENGTIAAGATGLSGSALSASDYIRFDINRPFIFAIRDPKTGLILFMGRVLNPINQ